MGDGKTQAWLVANKPKKKKPTTTTVVAPPPPIPKPVYDSEGRAHAVASAYFNRTGKLPSPEKLYTFVKVTNSPVFDSQEKFNALFPDWVGEMDADKDDIHPLDMFLNPAKAAFEEMQRNGRILDPAERAEELRQQKSNHELTRKLDQIEERKEKTRIQDETGRVPTETETEKKEAYYRLSQGQGTEMFYEDQDKSGTSSRLSDDLEVRRGLQGNDLLMAPNNIQRTRKLYFEKGRSDLAATDRLALDEFAQKLAFTYGDEFASYYDFDVHKVTWDAHFDSFVSRYILEANLPYAMMDTTGDDNGQIRKQAMRNIEIATHGKIKADTDVYALMKMMGIQGDPDNPMRASDQYSEMLFAGYYNGRRENWSQKEAIIAYAADFGEEYLPQSAKAYYEEAIEDFRAPMAYGESIYNTLSLAASEAEAHPERAGLNPKDFEVPEGYDANLVNGALLETVLTLAESSEGEEFGAFDAFPGYEDPRVIGKAGPSKSQKAIRAEMLNYMVRPAAGMTPSLDPLTKYVMSVPERAIMGVIMMGRSGLESLTHAVAGDENWNDWDNMTLPPQVAALAKQQGIEGDVSAQDIWNLTNAQVNYWDTRGSGWTSGMQGLSHFYLDTLDESFDTNMGQNGKLLFTFELVGGLALDILADKGMGAMARGMKSQAILAGRLAATDAAKLASRRAGAEIGEEMSDQAVRRWFGRKLLKAFPGRSKALDDLALYQKDTLDKLAAATARGDKNAMKQLRKEAGTREARIRDIEMRPLWHDSMAMGLARGKQPPSFINLLFDISDDGLGGVKADGVVDDIAKANAHRSVQTIVRRIGQSTDQEEIGDLFLKLKSDYGVIIDSGADFLTRARVFNQILDGRTDASFFFSHAMPTSQRIPDGVDMTHRILFDTANMVRFGLAAGDTKTFAKTMREFMEKLDAIKGTTYKEISSKRQAIYAEMWDRIEDNFKARGVTKAEKKYLKFMAKWSGVEIDPETILNQMDLFKAIQAIKRGGKRGRAAAAHKYAKMYYPIQEIDEVTGMAVVKEGSKVTRRPVQYLEAEGRVKHAQKTLKGVQKAHKAGKVGGKELEGAERALEIEQTNLALVRKTYKITEPQPFLEGQLSRDLIQRYSPHELALFQSGHGRGEALLHLGVGYGVGPSMHGASTAFRTFVLARLGFGVTMALGDEFWRLIPEGVWKTMIGKHGEWKATKLALKNRKLIAKAHADNVSQLLKNSNAWVGVTSDAADYHVWMNAYIEMLRSQEHSVDLMTKLPRFVNADGTLEATAAYRSRLRTAMKDMIDADTREGSIIREHLRQMGRLPRTGYRTPAGKAADQTAFERDKARLEDEYGTAYTEVERNRMRQEEIIGRVGKLGSPAKTYKVSWLRRKAKADAAPVTKPHDIDGFLGEVEGMGVREYDGSIRIEDGETSVRVHLVRGDEYGSPQDIYLLKVESQYAGTGSGSRVQEKVFDAADRHGVSMSGTPQGTEAPAERMLPDGSVEPNPRAGNTPDDVLEKYYKANGWTVTRDSRGNLTMVREPKKPSGLTQADIDGMSDDKILAMFGKDPDVNAQLKREYHRDVVRKRAQEQGKPGLNNLYQELGVLRDERLALDDALREARKRRNKVRYKDDPEEFQPRQDFDKWLEQTLDNLLAFDSHPALSSALRTGKQLSKDEVKAAVKALRESGMNPPIVIGVKNLPARGDGYVPGLSQWADFGPFRIVEAISGMMRRATFTKKHMDFYDELIKAGVDEDVAFGRAAHYAERATDRSQFTHNMTAWEYMTRDMILFQPAYRQFARYWGEQFVKHPMLMTDIRRKGSEFPSYTIPGTNMQSMLPMPFWMKGGIEDLAIPGFSPLVIMPLRMVNYATGWEYDEDQEKYIYTGNTKLDWMSKVPMLSFTKPSMSMAGAIDDLLWGIVPQTFGGLEQDNLIGAALRTGQMSLFKDPYKRQQLAMNIMNAQISAGIKPDFAKGMEEMRKTPWWWKVIEMATGGQAQNPDALLTAGTRMLNPFSGTVWYEPGDENAKLKDAPFWEQWSGSTPRSMADAQMEFMKVYGDKEKMDKVLETFPRYKEVVNFWNMDIDEREDYLSQDTNLWIVPYITGKYVYEDGLPLVGGEFFEARKEGSIYRKSSDDYLKGMQQLFLDIGWTKTLTKLEKDYKADMRTANKFARDTIIRLADGNKYYKERLQQDYDAYLKEYSTEEPGGRSGVPDRSPPAWLEMAAMQAGINGERASWDVGFIQKRMDDSYKVVSEGGKRLEYEPKDLQASAKGVHDRWLDDGIYNKEEWDEKLGAALTLSHALTKYVTPKYRNLVDIKYSAYYNDIKEQVKKHDNTNWYLTKSIVTDPNYFISNVQQLAAIGVDIDSRAALMQGMQDRQKAYWDFKRDSEGLDTWSDEYKSLRAKYITERNAIDSRKGMEIFANGIASKVMASLARNGKGVDKNLMKHVVAVMNKKGEPNVAGLGEFWMDRITARDYSVPSRIKKTAWATLAAVAISYRNAMKATWNEDMKAYGISPASKAGKEYLRKLHNYATLCSSVSPDFRRQYEELGGAELLYNMLDATQ